MKFELASSLLLPFLAAAAPTDSGASAPAENPTAFTVMQSFWLGGEPGTYCPLTSGCPPGNMTVLAGNGGSLSVVVPGGQQIYVSPEGALKFTQAHSAYIPTVPLSVPLNTRPAPPDPPSATTSTPVFAALQNATVPSGSVDDCLGFSALAVPTDDAGNTWQYI
ncbi:hypothetical protein AOCH_006970 [Aspergillus ochraceoroseus]|uniref:IgE-binding protein n=1 Tax=Aspergillus ochraceoroseus TaxID=138278 RepID=A0A0F8UCB0_9EURO|nr:hypothetical protein AOCH_006970 [Aspergillus ochraceoroseus]